MVAFEPQSQTSRANRPWQNVRGWERLLTIGGGLLFAALGASHRDTRSDKQLGIASLLLMRGLSGHCSVKSALDDPLEEIRYLRARVQRLQELVMMAEQVADRTRSQPPSEEPTLTSASIEVEPPRYAQGL